MTHTYLNAGVDISAGERLVEQIGPLAAATARRGSMGRLGGFGALFDLAPLAFRDPLLVSTTDGVGTKILLARDANAWTHIGQDLVAMCVNDLLVQGAEPLFFLDYLATGHLEVEVARTIVASIAAACASCGCQLAGGETAEMPGLYQTGDIDLAGFAVGIVERDQLLPREVKPGQVVLGLASSGLHSNGFSLVRQLASPDEMAAPCEWAPHHSLRHELLTPTTLYVKPVLPLMQQGKIQAAAHITGGGLASNLSRVLPKGVGAALELPMTLLPVFEWIRSKGVMPDEMLTVFNCGQGMALVVDPQDQDAVVQDITQQGIAVSHLGNINSCGEVTVKMI